MRSLSRSILRSLRGRAAALAAIAASAALLALACGGGEPAADGVAIEAVAPVTTASEAPPPSAPAPPTPPPAADAEPPPPAGPPADAPAEVEALRDRLSSLGAATDGALGAASRAVGGEAEALARAHYRAAIAAQDAGAPAEAAAASARALDAGGPLAPVARLRLGQQLHAAGESDAAVERLAEAVADPALPPALRPPARLDLAAVLDELGRSAEVLAALDALAGSPRPAGARSRRAAASATPCGRTTRSRCCD